MSIPYALHANVDNNNKEGGLKMVGTSPPLLKKLALPNFVHSVFMWCIAYCYSDFGMAQHLTINEVAESFRGSPLYMVCVPRCS